jgi:CHAT domain-containing protein
LGLLFGCLLLNCHEAESPGSRYVEQLLATYRQIYPRLSIQQSARACREISTGLLARWSCPSSEEESASSRRLLAEGLSLQRALQKSGTAESHRRLAFWYLLASHDRKELDAAIDQLATATETDPLDPTLWSDLAALEAWKASMTQDPRPLENAFHAIERAVGLNPDLPEALFNRAWILDLLQLPRAAHDAWTLYLRKEKPVSPWRREAEKRLAALQAPTLTETWEPRQLDRELSMGRLDDARIAAFVAALPSGAWRWVVTSLLPAWGEAWQRGDSAAAGRNLHAARIVAEAFRQKWGDTLLVEGISGIESTIQTGPRQRIARLVRGVLAFREAVENNERSRPGKVLEQLGIAALGFEGNAEAFLPCAAEYEAASLYAQGKYTRAGDRLRHLSEEISGRSYPYLRARLLQRQGSVENVSGSPETARRLLHKALEIFEGLPDPEYIAFVSALLGESYHLLGDREQSWKFLYKALVQNRRLGLPYREVPIYNILADFTLRSGDAGLSYVYQDAAVRSSGSLDNPSFCADVLLWRALLHARFGRSEAAARDLEAAARQTAKIVDPSRAEQSRADAGLISGAITLEKDPAASVQSLDRAVARYQKTGHWPNRLLAYEARAQAYGKLGQTARQKADLLMSLQIHERIGKDLTEDAYRLSLAGLIESVFDQMVRLEAIEEKNLGRSVYFLERSRTMNWPMLRNSESAAIEPVTPQALSAVLPPRTALVEYSVLADRLLVWARTTTSMESHEILLPHEEIERLVKQFTEERWPGPRWEQASARLYQILIAPWFNPRLYDTIVVIPDKDLYRISFPALWSTSTHRFLIEDAAIVVAPSETLFAHATERDRELALADGTPKILVVANPALGSAASRLGALEHSRREGEKISSLFPNATILLKGDAAVPPAFFRLLPEAGWLHFAGHAVASPDHPLDSVLVFAEPHSGGSGEVTGRELQAQSFPRTRLVVLAACSTAAAPEAAWPGAMTLARPFLTAGVPAVLGSLWRVDDEEAERLFDTFYAEVRKGAPPAAALRAAQLRMLHEKGRSSVHKGGWPAFQLIGGMTTTFSTRRDAP